MEFHVIDLVKLVSRLWNNEFPLVQKYFGKYLYRLITAHIEEPFDGHFILAAFMPEMLEQRLRDIDEIGITKEVIQEVSIDQKPMDLDKRLMNAWAELRTASQLKREGFERIEKIIEIGDLKAVKANENYVLQVTRIEKSLAREVEKRNQSEDKDSSPYGTIDDIYRRLNSPLSFYFWDALERKNDRFKYWSDSGFTRCIVIVSSDDDLQDGMVRHIACRNILEGIHLLNNVHFDMLYWLPDTGNGALFIVGDNIEDTKCLADWQDSINNPEKRNERIVQRVNIDLHSSIPPD